MDSIKDISCQIYKYDNDFFLISKNSPEYFAKEFASTEIHKDKVVWLNFHDITDNFSIERLGESLSIDKLSIEDIFKEKHRPKLEEYPTYLFSYSSSFDFKKSFSESKLFLMKSLISETLFRQFSRFKNKFCACFRAF